MDSREDTPLPFDWAALPRIELGLGGQGKRLRTEVWSLALAGGREVALEAIMQRPSYRGVLNGAGFRRVGESCVRSALLEARTVFGWDEARPLHVLPPRMFGYQSNIARPTDPPNICNLAVLPPVCTMAEFRSASPARDPAQTYSSLLVIWFQDAYGLPDAEHVLEGLRQIPWNELAWDWDY